MAQGDSNSAAATHTKFFVFETDADKIVWTYKGHVIARDRQHALTLAYPKATRDDLERVERAAVSENGWKPELFGGPPPSMPDLPLTAAAPVVDEVPAP